MDDKQQDRVLSVTKHLVTLALAGLGFVMTIMFTSSGGEPLIKVTEYTNSLQASLILFFCTIVFGFLVEASILSISLGYEQRSIITKPISILVLAWFCFISATVALVVFSLATMSGTAPINF